MIVSIPDRVYLVSCLFGIASIWDRDNWGLYHLRLRPNEIVSIEDCNFWDRVQDPIFLYISKASFVIIVNTGTVFKVSL